jgi:hypothetical protein
MRDREVVDLDAAVMTVPPVFSRGSGKSRRLIASTVEGRERYGVAIRYPRARRSDPNAIARDVQVALPGG